MGTAHQKPASTSNSSGLVDDAQRHHFRCKRFAAGLAVHASTDRRCDLKVLVGSAHATWLFDLRNAWHAIGAFAGGPADGPATAANVHCPPATPRSCAWGFLAISRPEAQLDPQRGRRGERQKQRPRTPIGRPQIMQLHAISITHCRSPCRSIAR